jgi:hypothetical protein
MTAQIIPFPPRGPFAVAVAAGFGAAVEVKS